jgi:hypothetical protein
MVLIAAKFKYFFVGRSAANATAKRINVTTGILNMGQDDTK